jgi:hypothetical protein
MMELRRMRLAGSVTRMEGKINPHRNFEGKSRRKAPLGSHRHMRKYNIKKNLNEVV